MNPKIRVGMVGALFLLVGFGCQEKTTPTAEVSVTTENLAASSSTYFESNKALSPNGKWAFFYRSKENIAGKDVFEKGNDFPYFCYNGDTLFRIWNEKSERIKPEQNGVRFDKNSLTPQFKGQLVPIILDVENKTEKVLTEIGEGFGPNGCIRVSRWLDDTTLLEQSQGGDLSSSGVTWVIDVRSGEKIKILEHFHGSPEFTFYEPLKKNSVETQIALYKTGNYVFEQFCVDEKKCDPVTVYEFSDLPSLDGFNPRNARTSNTLTLTSPISIDKEFSFQSENRGKILRIRTKTSVVDFDLVSGTINKNSSFAEQNTPIKWENFKTTILPKQAFDVVEHAHDFNGDGISEYILYYTEKIIHRGVEMDKYRIKVYRYGVGEWILDHEDEGTSGWIYIHKNSFYSSLDIDNDGIQEAHISKEADGTGHYLYEYYLQWNGEKVGPVFLPKADAIIQNNKLNSYLKEGESFGPIQLWVVTQRGSNKRESYLPICESGDTFCEFRQSAGTAKARIKFDLSRVGGIWKMENFVREDY